MAGTTWITSTVLKLRLFSCPRTTRLPQCSLHRTCYKRRGGKKGFPNELAFSPNGRLLAGLGADNVIRIWDVASGTLLHTLGGYLSKVRTLTFSPDSRLLVTGSGYTTFHFWTAYTIRIWDVQSGESLEEL